MAPRARWTHLLPQSRLAATARALTGTPFSSRGGVSYNLLSMTQVFESEPRTLNHPLVDGHTHIDQFDPDEMPSLLDRAHQASVGLIIAAGTTVKSCERVVQLAEVNADGRAGALVRAGIGLHPADLQGWLDSETASRLRTLAAHQQVVEWSETGLDYMPSSPAWDMQQDAFRKQIRLARELGLPLVTHSREADDDVLRILREEGAGEVGGAWHYFGGDLALAEQAMELGFYVSLAKPLLREEALQQVVAQLPRDRLVRARLVPRAPTRDEIR